MDSHLSDDKLKQEPHYDHQLNPFSFYHTEVENGRPDTLFHWHNDMEINYVHEGTARYHVDYDFFNSQPGDIVLLRPNALHSIHPIDNERHVTDTVLFHLDMVGYSILDQTSLSYLQPLQNSTFKFKTPLQPGDSGYEEIKACLFEIFEIMKEKPDYYELLLRSKLSQILFLIYQHGHVLKKRSDDLYRKNERIRDLIDYINRHYAESMTIEQLAQQLGYSKTHFMNVFKQHTGTSCTDFIIQVRLNAAANLLSNTVKPILEIATDVGYNNLSNFNRQFKHYYQLTPSQYRKQFKKQV